LSGAIFGSALQSPWVVGLIVVVLLSLATSMFGLWELRVPGWAQRASGGRSGVFGALVMGLVMGFVAAPCIGPFVVGLLTYVGQRGDALLGFALFFTLAMGLGLPYLILGTFTGAVSKLPASGMWMVGVRRVFGVILIAMAAYFAAPLMPGNAGRWLMSAVLVIGALYLLVIDRTGHEQPTIDRVMRVLAAASCLHLQSASMSRPLVNERNISRGSRMKQSRSRQRLLAEVRSSSTSPRTGVLRAASSRRRPLLHPRSAPCSRATPDSRSI
jgi:thiol:disulfide interchange protein DsbD